MILERLEISPEELAHRTGWKLEPQGACKGDRCVPLPTTAEGRLDARVLGERLGMELVHDERHGLWALGPESGGRALLSAELPEIALPDRHGSPFPLPRSGARR